MTLVELSVAMAIGLFLIGGALYVYSQSKNSYRAGDSLARLQESAALHSTPWSRTSVWLVTGG